MNWVKRLSFLLAPAILAPMLTAGSVKAELFYALQFNGELWNMDTTTQLATRVGMTGITVPNSLAVSASGTLYSVGGGSTNPNMLYTIDPTTGVGTQVAPITFNMGTPDISGIAFDGSGSLFALSGSSLYSLNPATGTGTLIGTPTGFTAAASGDLAFSPSGTLYAYFNTFEEGLVTYNKLTGQANLIGNATFHDTWSLAFDSNGVLWAHNDDNTLATINLATGAMTEPYPNGHFAGGFRGLALAPVPIPATVWLFGSGLAAMIGFARRRNMTMS